MKGHFGPFFSSFEDFWVLSQYRFPQSFLYKVTNFKNLFPYINSRKCQITPRFRPLYQDFSSGITQEAKSHKAEPKGNYREKLLNHTKNGLLVGAGSQSYTSSLSCTANTIRQSPSNGFVAASQTIRRLLVRLEPAALLRRPKGWMRWVISDNFFRVISYM